MKIEINGIKYPVIIDRKRGNKRTYLRVKNDLTIYITTSLLTPSKIIEKVIVDNYKGIEKMIDKVKRQQNEQNQFLYLGKHYDLVYTDGKDVTLGEQKVFVGRDVNLDVWYKKEAKKVFLEHLNLIYNRFSEDIVYPSLRVRKMTSRWGVCNTRDKIITLNTELMKKDPKYLDYVIVHELSHLVEANHSASFWEIVSRNCSDYKEIRKEMRS